MSKEENHLIEERRKKLAELKKLGNAFPNDFRRKNLAQDLKNSFDNLSKEDLQKKKKKVSVAGRIMLRRMMGKASFTTIQDFSGRIQLYVRADEVSNYNDFKNKKGSVTQTILAKIDVIIHNQNQNEVNLFVRRSFSQHLFSWMNDSASRL